MKQILISLTLLILAGSVLAQKGGIAPLGKGKVQLNFGAGYNTTAFPVVYFAVDIAVHKDITITPEINSKFIKDFHFGTLVKADYHWNFLMGIPSTFDFYSGFRGGFDAKVSKKAHFEPDFKFETGGRWYFSPNWALNAEIAGGTGFESTFGMSVKL